ncbi:AbrB/MazE/SpoVT family DNA-binding domain-containing protein [Methanobacterium aggregans]|uniref:AbrB/MazE/SpoVT family DNA-binding domain-containing protein n=1 Tax=Methanobacterium aggregans TaxID=1615586 RepID=UPI001FD8D643|nr:AbrB/MazE/SpoVT family DNA-binding domain-containing protein [Methanobacterium aggregans]MBP2044956.1 bifunctional DNA-binding transcriptional regulator/antitoxin component of YhaV-PrlF toxin-antitoxin module [Methanobacterium aggregans]
MIYKTELSNDFQTIIPPEIRNKFKISPGDQIEWIISNNGVKLKFRKKVSIDEVFGIIDSESDAVELKRKVQRGDKF